MCQSRRAGEARHEFRFIASDIHGSAYYCEQLLQASSASRLRVCCCSAIFFTTVRETDLPRDYAPKKVIAMLNGMADTILCVRGNCDTEVDQMVLAFPILADYAVLPTGERLVYVTHGHQSTRKHRLRCVRAMCCCTDIRIFRHGSRLAGKTVYS